MMYFKKIIHPYWEISSMKNDSVSSRCDDCLYYEYDEEWDDYSCIMDLDEDEMRLYLMGRFSSCPYYKPGNEYSIVKKQI